MLGLTGRIREPISKVDTAWLRMERPTNLMMITGVISFDRAVDVERLKQTIAARFLSFKRFQQKAVETANGAYWEVDADFDIDAHLRVVALPGAADKAELEELVSELASTPLDQSKPLWQFTLVENHRRGPALITRIHHCYADGMALVEVMLSLTDIDRDAQAPAEVARSQFRLKGGTVIERLSQAARANFDRAIKASRKAVGRGLDVLKDPHLAQIIAREGAEIATEFTHAVTLPDDPQTVFKGRLGVRKRVAWADPLPLEEVKAVSKALGVTVNDFLISCMTGALRHYLVGHHGEEQLSGLSIRATVPVNLRPREHARQLGNHFGLVFLDLPVGEEDPMVRVQKVRANMERLKSSKQAGVTFGLLSALGMGPAFLQRPALELFSRKATTVMTNVPGPTQPLYLAGAPIREMMFWVPQTGAIGMGLSIFSYNGSVYVGLITDRRLVPDPQHITERFAVEFDNLVYIALLKAAADLADAEAGEGSAELPPTPAKKPRARAARKPSQARERN